MHKTIAHARGSRKARTGRPAGRRRALGQHFLAPGTIPDRLVRDLAPRPGEAILEVGPGRGALTRGLLAAGARVLAVEVDERLAAALSPLFEQVAGARLVRADLLRIDLPALLHETFGAGPARCLSSLPYSTGTAILERLCDAMPPLTEIIVLLQKEVVDRAVAAPGTAAYGYLSVALRSRCAVRAGLRVRPGAFDPPPRVDSQALALTPLAHPPVPAAQRTSFLSLMGRLFAHRRKTLLNNLRAAGMGEAALAAAASFGGPLRRPGEWSIEELAALYARLSAAGALC